MIALVLTTCLVAAPADCQAEQPIPFNGPLSACVVAGQFAAAQWQADHPARRVKRWSCGPAQQGA